MKLLTKRSIRKKTDNLLTKMMNKNTPAKQLFIAQNPIKPTKNYEGSNDGYRSLRW